MDYICPVDAAAHLLEQVGGEELKVVGGAGGVAGDLDNLVTILDNVKLNLELAEEGVPVVPVYEELEGVGPLLPHYGGWLLLLLLEYGLTAIDELSSWTVEGVRAVNISGYLMVGLPRVVTGLSTNELESNDGFVVVLKSLNPRPAASSHLISSDGRRPTAQLRWWWFLSKVAVVAIWEWLARFSLEPTMVMSVMLVLLVLLVFTQGNIDFGCGGGGGGHLEVQGDIAQLLLGFTDDGVGQGVILVDQGCWPCSGCPSPWPGWSGS